MLALTASWNGVLFTHPFYSHLDLVPRAFSSTIGKLAARLPPAILKNGEDPGVKVDSRLVRSAMCIFIVDFYSLSFI